MNLAIFRLYFLSECPSWQSVGALTAVGLAAIFDRAIDNVLKKFRDIHTFLNEKVFIENKNVLNSKWLCVCSVQFCFY